MIFKMTRPEASSTSLIVLVCVLLICFCIFFVMLSFSAQSYHLEVKDGMLNIQSIFYNTHIGLDKIDIKNIRMVNYDALEISSRSNGIGLPGLKIGWFQGIGKKYKLYVTDKENVLLIPTYEKYNILFSTTQGKKIIDMFHQ